MSHITKANASTDIELGKLKSNNSLKPDISPGPIPETDYSVCRSIAGDLAPGDRVLIVWCGDEPVIIDAIK
ncbi:hypothetical protein OBO34_19615 [Clostridiales Family XIII bacterium ASD5510]|uniref:Uncharacterized protein n=1 Tax=Hominibacterium faecale TaxID=2839743 RepID=A0A9J6QYG7_9FIRM|nr:hypothetical protein [Hominibacterium faecale]MCU7380524.1 hypothetical protein [Hominibacterium faecale]